MKESDRVDDSILPDFLDLIEDSEPFTEDNRPNCEVNLENLFIHSNRERARPKIGYQDYKELTEDFSTMSINEGALKKMEEFGYPRRMVSSSLAAGHVNHATATYHLLVTL